MHGFEIQDSGNREGRSLLANLAPVFDEEGDVTGVATVALDISEIRRAQEVNRRFHDAIEYLSECLALHDPDQRLVVCNDH